MKTSAKKDSQNDASNALRSAFIY